MMPSQAANCREKKNKKSRVGGLTWRQILKQNREALCSARFKNYLVLASMSLMLAKFAGPFFQFCRAEQIERA